MHGLIYVISISLLARASLQVLHVYSITTIIFIDQGSQQEFIVLPTDVFRRSKIESTSVKLLPKEYVRRLTFHR